MALPWSNESKRCRRNSKQCRPWSDCSSRSSLIWVCTVCPGISVRKLRIITVLSAHTFATWIRGSGEWPPKLFHDKSPQKYVAWFIMNEVIQLTFELGLLFLKTLKIERKKCLDCVGYRAYMVYIVTFHISGILEQVIHYKDLEWLWGAFWKFCHERNWSASWGLLSDAEQLSRVKEFSICTEQRIIDSFSCILFFNNCI